MTAARTPDSAISVMSFMKRANSLLKRIAPLQGMKIIYNDIFHAFRMLLLRFSSLGANNEISYSCSEVGDDPFVPCFGCDNGTPRSSFDRRNDPDADDKQNFGFTDRQSAEGFRVTAQQKRIICRRGSTTGRSCRIRASRAAEIRRLGYQQNLRFIQAESYLSQDDIDIIRFFQTLFL